MKALALGLVILASFIVFPHVEAQTATPQILITWRALRSYVPSSYPDKAMPSYGSPVIASVELISGGKIINIKSQTIYWYLNDNLIDGGTGIQTVTFLPYDVPPNSLTLRVEIPQYNGGTFLTAQTLVQTLQPVAVIDAPFPNGQTGSNPINVSALPYFFNVGDASNLSYAWSVNGQAGQNTENPETAQITLPAGTSSGTALDLTLTIKNPSDSSVGTAYSTITYAQQL